MRQDGERRLVVPMELVRGCGSVLIRFEGNEVRLV